MAIPLTAAQDAYVAQMAADFQAFKTALVQSLKADNDPAHDLGDSRGRAAALIAAFQVLSISTGAYGAPNNASGALLRTPAPPRIDDTVLPQAGLPRIP